jgi:WD40 repeat protein
VQQRSDDEALVISAVPSGKPLALIHGADVPGRKEVIGSTMAFTRDGKYLASVCWEGRCGIWETATGRLVRWLESGPFYSIVKCDFSPDDKLLAVGAGAPQGRTEGITVGVYEVASGKQLFTTPGTNSVFAPDGRSLVTWDGYGHGAVNPARRVEVPSGKELNSFAYREHFPDFAPRSDGVWFFEVRADNTIRVWDVSSAKPKHTFPGQGGGDGKLVYVRHLASRRELISVSTQPAEVVCWDLHTGKRLWQHRLAAPAYYPALSADGNTLVTGESTGTVRVWDVATGNERASFRPGIIGHATYEVQVSPDGKRIVTLFVFFLCSRERSERALLKNGTRAIGRATGGGRSAAGVVSRQSGRRPLQNYLDASVSAPHTREGRAGGATRRPRCPAKTAPELP